MIAAAVIIPCAPEHEHLLARAVASAKAQTLPVEVVPVLDIDRRGAGYTRNRGVERSCAPLLVFLDADDELDPAFVATALAHYRPGGYVYTDWYQGGVVCHAPDCDAWVNGSFHLVTTLVPRRMFEAAGGFDEHLPAIEDTDFYLKARTLGFCGVHAPVPLVHYHAGGRRSHQFRLRPDADKVRRAVFSRWKGQLMACGCKDAPPPMVAGGRQQGDVLAQTNYAPMTQVVGGRFYPRPTHMGARVWVSRAHAAARPDLWTVVSDPEADAPDVERIVDLARAAMA